MPAIWMEGGIVGLGGLDHSQVGGGFHDIHGGPLCSQGGGSGSPSDHGWQFGRWTMRFPLGEVGDGHVQ